MPIRYGARPALTTMMITLCTRLAVSPSSMTGGPIPRWQLDEARHPWTTQLAVLSLDSQSYDMFARRLSSPLRPSLFSGLLCVVSPTPTTSQVLLCKTAVVREGTRLCTDSICVVALVVPALIEAMRFEDAADAVSNMQIIL